MESFSWWVLRNRKKKKSASKTVGIFVFWVGEFGGVDLNLLGCLDWEFSWFGICRFGSQSGVQDNGVVFGSFFFLTDSQKLDSTVFRYI